MSELEIYKGMVKKMKDDEIKEILDYFKDDIEFLEKELINTNFLGRYITIRDKECGYLKKLLDYITNLQQENERLKEENKHIFANVNDDQLLISNAMNWAEAQDYKSRCEKANEFINHNKQKTICAYGDNEDDDFEICLWEEDIDDLLNILNGSDE